MNRTFALFLFIITALQVFSQTADSTAKKYVTVNATGEVFMCPVLTPRFTNQIQKKFKAKDIEVTNKHNTFSFTTTALVINADSVKVALYNSAIPLNIITDIKISDQPVPSGSK